MKYLCKHYLTTSHLRIWAKRRKLVTASFFFWSAGRDALQKSQEGLLRAILYQILRQSPEFIPQAFPSQWEACGGGNRGANRGVPNSDFLTTMELLAAFERISKQLASSDVKYCLFIDGLDEYEGKPDDIIQLVQLLKSSLQIKVCISSRPWNEFEKVFGQDATRKLYMQDLTRSDIELYLRDVLENDVGFQDLKQRDSRCLDLVQDIADAAKGVFLWVFLVVRSLLEGITNSDRVVDLQRRLELLPTDLNEYFERILFTVDNFYRRQTAQMLQVTLMAHDTLPLMSYWFIDQDDPRLIDKSEFRPSSRDVNNSRLDQMKRRLNACCKGLLEAQVTQPVRSTFITEESDRIFFYLKADFLHRTVRDFLCIPDMQNMLRRWIGADFDANNSICEAILAQLKTSPRDGNYFEPGSPSLGLIGTFLYHTKILEDS